jgi:2-keto-4-pentenoate hydratase/2-oxohepta-3-ene-1,7-dioic acid hydratase in catechol pathway
MTHWVRYTHAGETGFGILHDNRIAEHSGDLFDDPQATGRELELGAVELLTPVRPSKMVALANNFHALLAKTGAPTPSEPLYFFKANSSFHPTGKPIRRPPGYSGKIIFEGELGLVIGRTCRNVEADDALQYVFGCTCINDVTAIETLNEDPTFQQWTRCKAADTFGVMGPVVASGLDPGTLSVCALLDGQERQNYPITDMVFTPAQLVSRISRDMTLLPGDVIACGTNIGVGSLRPGNTIEIAIEGIGSLVNVFEPEDTFP